MSLPAHPSGYQQILGKLLRSHGEEYEDVFVVREKSHDGGGSKHL
jgi:hypothetical protein